MTVPTKTTFVVRSQSQAEPVTVQLQLHPNAEKNRANRIRIICPPRFRRPRRQKSSPFGNAKRAANYNIPMRPLERPTV